MTHLPLLSCARRFVLVGTDGTTVGDGAVFGSAAGPVVIWERGTDVVTTYPSGALQLTPFANHVQWIDAERPTRCAAERPTRG